MSGYKSNQVGELCALMRNKMFSGDMNHLRNRTFLFLCILSLLVYITPSYYG